MRKIDVANWNRSKHYELFRTYRQPFFTLSFRLDITRFLPRIKALGNPFFLTFMHAVLQATNQVEALRLRIREDGVYLHDQVHASYTLMTNTGVFRFFTAHYQSELEMFLHQTIERAEAAKDAVDVTDAAGVDDLVFVTSMPWVAFTSVEHAMPGHPLDSFPRLSWGKYERIGDKIEIPFSISCHHALVDGQDIGAFVIHLQTLLDSV
jgi:chloramphenicol O-acetyltransferase type A